jgi:hypothetical protein
LIGSSTRKIILWLAAGALFARCIFNYVPGDISMSFPLASPMPDGTGNISSPVIPLPYWAHYVGDFLSFLCCWAALRLGYPKLKFEFTVLAISELAALFDFVLRYGQDIIWTGFDAHSLQFLALGFAIPAKYLYIRYGGTRIKT